MTQPFYRPECEVVNFHKFTTGNLTVFISDTRLNRSTSTLDNNSCVSL
jgi:hypothetical protein